MDKELNKYLSGYLDAGGISVEIDNKTIQMEILIFMTNLRSKLELFNYVTTLSSKSRAEFNEEERIHFCEFLITTENKLFESFLRDISKYTLLKGPYMYNIYKSYKTRNWDINYWESEGKQITEKSRIPGIAYFAGLFDSIGEVWDDRIIIVYGNYLDYIKYLRDVLETNFGINIEIINNIDENNIPVYDLCIYRNDTVNFNRFLTHIYPFTFYNKLG